MSGASIGIGRAIAKALALEVRRRAFRQPVGQIGKTLSSPSRKNILIFRIPKSGLYPLPSRLDQRGVSRSSRT